MLRMMSDAPSTSAVMDWCSVVLSLGRMLSRSSLYVLDEGDEATSPSLRSILAENRIVRERRQLAGGGELGFLYAGDEDILVM